MSFIVILGDAEHGEVSPQSKVRGDDPGVLIADLDYHLGAGALDAISLTRVTAAVVTLWERCVLPQRYHHMQSVAHRFKADAEQLQAFYVRESKVHLRDQLQPFHPPEITQDTLSYIWRATSLARVPRNDGYTFLLYGEGQGWVVPVTEKFRATNAREKRRARCSLIHM